MLVFKNKELMALHFDNQALIWERHARVTRTKKDVATASAVALAWREAARTVREDFHPEQEQSK
jgi:hypothetical protein